MDKFFGVAFLVLGLAMSVMWLIGAEGTDHSNWILGLMSSLLGSIILKDL